MLKLLDFFFIIFHTLLIIFNLFGWLFRYTRKLNLITLLLTGSSWLILGIYYGMGYCPLTDWHFRVLEKLGETNLPSSYIAYLLNRITGIQIIGSVVDCFTLCIFLCALALSIIFNIKDARLKAK